MTSILAGPATHIQGPPTFPRTAMSKRTNYSSKKRGATAVPTGTSTGAFNLTGMNDPANSTAGVGGLGGPRGTTTSNPLESNNLSPSMGQNHR